PGRHGPRGAPRLSSRAVRAVPLEPLAEGSSQSTGSAPIATRYSLTRENGREPKKPRCAESGLGCGLSITGTDPSAARAERASRPHSTATSGPPRATRAPTASAVTDSQPRPRCEPAIPAWTVSEVLSRSTPWAAHGLRSPFAGVGTPTSLLSSVKMFTSERGKGVTSLRTENASPIACPGVG